MRWIFIFIYCLISSLTFSQSGYFFPLNKNTGSAPPAPTIFPYFGHGGSTQNLSNGNAQDFEDYNCKYIQSIYRWDEVEPTNGGYDFSEIGTNLTTADAHGFAYIGLQINVGTAAPFPWLVAAGVDTFYTNSGVEPGPYPDYYNETYLAAYYDLYSALFTYIDGLALGNIVIYVKVVWSSTGDTAPYKGTCIGGGCPGIADDQTWSDYIHTTYSYIHGLRDLSGLPIILAMNPGNDLKELSWLYENYSDDISKKGDLGHDYLFNRENLYPTIGYTSQSEIQDYILSSTHAQQEVLPLMMSALQAGLKMPGITGGWISAIANLQVLDFFDEMVSQMYPPTATKGFIGFAQKISYDSTDISWLSTATYGAVIGNPSGYAATIAANNANVNYGSEYKRWLNAKAQETYINSARVTAIQAGANADAQFNSSDIYFNDGGYHLATNYALNVTQNNVHTTSIGKYRVTQSPDTSIYGRFAMVIDTATVTETSFDIINTWSNSTTLADVAFDVVYFDSGTGSWSIQADVGSGMADIATQTNTNSGLWLHKTVTASGMVLGTSTDFRLHYTSGENTKFCFIKFTNTTP